MSPEVLQKLKDIKPPVPVPDMSLWWWLMAVVLAVLVVLVVRYFLRRGPCCYRPRRRDRKQEAVERLKRLDGADTKETVYAFTELFPLVAGENTALMAEYEALVKRLARYKYQKEVPPLGREDRRAIKALIAKGVKGG